MKIIRTLFIASLLSLISTSLYAQDYYVCPTGDDNNVGTSEFAPLKTAERGLNEFNKINGGDSILFCRGSSFDVFTSVKLFNQKCSDIDFCTLGAYGDPTNERPILTAKGLGNLALIRFEDGGDPNKDGGYLVQDLMLVSDGTSGYGVVLQNDVDDIQLKNLRIQDFEIGVKSSGSNPIIASDVNGKNDRVSLSDSVIINNSRQGWLGGCDDCIIENNRFINNGFGEAKFNHNVYISSSKGITIRGNYLYKSAIVDGKCQGVSLVGHGVMTDVLIENNTIEEDEGAVTGGCWGIAIDTGYHSEEEFNNLIIRNNTITNVGGLAIGCSSCVGVTIEGNTIIDPSGSLSSGISVPNRAEDTVKSNDVNISGNRVLLGKTGSSGISIGGSNVFSVVNNSIEQPSSAYAACIKRASASANADTDISSNQCNKYVSFSDVYDGTNPKGATPIDETPIDATPIDATPIDATPKLEIPKGEEPIDATPIHINSTDVGSTRKSSIIESAVYESPEYQSSTDVGSTRESSTIVSAVYISPSYSSLSDRAKSTKDLKLTCRAVSSSGRCLMR